MASSDDDLRSNVKKWLESSGAPLEMKVARSLQMQGLDIQQSVYFEDPESGTIRETDIIATRAIRMSDSLTVAAIAVSECKFAPTPWVIFRGPPANDMERPNYQRIMTRHGEEWIGLLSSHPAISMGKMLQQEVRAGYALATSLIEQGQATSRSVGKDARQPSGKDLAYAAILSVTKAARSYRDLLDASPATTTLAIIFPIIVLRGSLFEAWYDGEELVVRQIQRGQVLWKRTPGEWPDLVDIVTEEALEEFAADFRESADDIVFYGKDEATVINITGVY